MAVIRPSDLPATANVGTGDALVVDSGSAVEKATPLQVVDAAIPLASQAEAEAGADNAKRVTPLRVKQAIAAQAVSLDTLASTSAGEGSELVGFLQPGTDAVATTVDAALKETVSVLRFGVVGDGSAADSAKIQAAVNSVKVGGANEGKSLLFPGGLEYACENISLEDVQNTEFIGYGATIRASQRVQAYFNCQNSLGGIVFKGFKFDQRQDVDPVYTQADYDTTYNCPIYLDASGSVTVEDCEFVKQYTIGVYVKNSGHVTVRRCRFEVPVCNQTFSGTPASQWWQCVHFQTTVGGVVENCTFNGAAITNPALGSCAVYASGITGRLRIINNDTDYMGRDNTGTHRLGVFDVYGDAVNVTVQHNTCTNTMSQFMRLSSTRNGRVFDNDITMSANAELDYSILSVEGSVLFSGQKGVEDIWVERNTFTDPAARAAYALGVIAYDWGKPSKNIHFNQNDFSGCRRALFVSGPFQGVTVDGNKSLDGVELILVTPGTGLTSDEGTEADSAFDRLRIANNENDNPTASSTKNGISLSLNTATTAYVGRFVVENNDVRANAASSQGIVIQTFSSNRANSIAVVRNNYASGYGYNYYIRDGGECIFENNRSRDAGTAPLLYTPGDMLNFAPSGNRWGDGVLRGQVTLTAGAATVTNNEIRTGDQVRFWLVTPGGTVGAASRGTITDATSFAVSSTSGTDTSTYGYEILH